MDGELIKIAIKAQGKTQEEVADLIGYTREWFGKQLKGKVKPLLVEKLRRAGIELDHISEQNENILEIENRYLKERVKDLESQLEDYKRMAGTLEKLLVEKNKSLPISAQSVKKARL